LRTEVSVIIVIPFNSKDEPVVFSIKPAPGGLHPT
jgi:hypothetical protein